MYQTLVAGTQTLRHCCLTSLCLGYCLEETHKPRGNTHGHKHNMDGKLKSGLKLKPWICSSKLFTNISQ